MGQGDEIKEAGNEEDDQDDEDAASNGPPPPPTMVSTSSIGWNQFSLGDCYRIMEVMVVNHVWYMASYNSFVE